MITEDAVRQLAAFSAGAPVTSCYLDVDGRRLPSHLDVQRELDAVVRRRDRNVTAAADGDGRAPSVAADVARIERFVRDGFDRSATRGLAMFSCSAAGWWQVHPLPVRVTSQLVVQPSPCVAQLEQIVDDYERFGLLLVDRQRARMFVFELGELVERTEALDPIVRTGADDRGERVKTRQGHQLAAQAHQHLRAAADLAFAVYQRHGFERFLVGAPAELASDLDALLHPYLRERLADRVHVSVRASLDAIRAAALEAEERAERRAEAELVAHLRDSVRAGGRAVAGLCDTLRALAANRVARLVVSQGYSAEGWRCACGALTPRGRRCPTCAGQMTFVPDVVELAVEQSLCASVRVEMCVNADLDVLGRIGATLRY